MTTRDHWDQRYRTTPVAELSWFESAATTSLHLLDVLDVSTADSVIDIGGGASPLTGDLRRRGFVDLTVLDVSEAALDLASRRVPDPAAVDWIAADVRTWQPARTWQVWHDRATFHFAVSDDDRDAYLTTLSTALAPGGALILATFAPDGPDHCSGLPVRRYDPDILAETISAHVPVDVIATEHQVHETPAGAVHAFTWAACRRRA